MKVLIIDDEDDTRSIASMSLSILGGVDVVEAEGGLEGIAKAEQDRPDVILLDMMMPGMDGSQTLIELQKNPRTLDIPVIFLTAKAMTTEVDRLVRMGAIAVLTKPFDPTTLATQVEQILEKRGLKVTPSTVSDSPNDYNSTAPVEPAPAPTQQPAFPPFSRENYQTSAAQTPGQNNMPPTGIPTAQTGGLISISRTSMFTGMTTIPPQGTANGGKVNDQQGMTPQGQQSQAYQQNQQNPQPQGAQQQYGQSNQQSGPQYSQNPNQQPQPQPQPRNPFELLAQSQQQWQPNGQTNQQNQNQPQQGLTPQQQQWIAQQSITSDYDRLPMRSSSAAFNQNFPQGIPAAPDAPPFTVPGYQGQLSNLTPEQFSEQQKKLQQSVTEGLPIPDYRNSGILGPRPSPPYPSQQTQTGGYPQAPVGTSGAYNVPPEPGQMEQQPLGNSGIPPAGYQQYTQRPYPANPQGTSGAHQVPPSGYQQLNPQGTSGSHPVPPPGYMPPHQQGSNGVRQTAPQSGGNSQQSSTNRNSTAAARTEADAVADPWVVAASENVQTSSSKGPLPKNAKITADIPTAKIPLPTIQPVKAPAAPPAPAANSTPATAAAAPTPANTSTPQAKPNVVKARQPKEESKEPERKKFAHPWGQIHKPDWSGEADPLLEEQKDSQRDSGNQGKRSTDDKK